MIWRFKRCWVQKYCVIRLLSASGWMKVTRREEKTKKPLNSIKNWFSLLFHFFLLRSFRALHGMARWRHAAALSLFLIELHPVSIDPTRNRKQILFVTREKSYDRGELLMEILLFSPLFATFVRFVCFHNCSPGILRERKNSASSTTHSRDATSSGISFRWWSTNIDLWKAPLSAFFLLTAFDVGKPTWRGSHWVR